MTSEAQRQKWKAQLTEALSNRDHNVSAMDILNLAVEKCASVSYTLLHVLTSLKLLAPSRSRVQHDLMQEEQSRNKGVGVTSWIGVGLRIQEGQ
jgi:hypothetical protein